MEYEKIDKDEIGQPIYYCEKHGEYFSNNCSVCMLIANDSETKKAGIKEVVDWVCSHTERLTAYPSFNRDEWQAKLKEWGIE